MEPSSNIFLEVLAEAATQPAAALVLGIFIGAAMMSGRSLLLFVGKFLRSMKTGQWENGTTTTLADIQKTLADLASNQLHNHKTAKALLEKQDAHDTDANKAFAKLTSDLDRLVQVMERVEDLLIRDGGRGKR